MGVASADTKEHDVAVLRLARLARELQQEAEIALFIAMQEPIVRIWARIERRDQAKVAIDAHQQHGAVDAVALDVSCMMVRRPDPRARLGDHSRACCD